MRSGKDLAVGRGYAVKSGQPTMLQIASPYDDLPLSFEQAAGEEDDRIPLALDYWVELILARHPEPKTVWFEQSETGQPESEETSGAMSVATRAADNPKLRQMLNLLRRAMLWEIQRREEDPEAEPVVPALLAKWDVSAWSDEATLREILKAIHRAISGLDGETYDAIYADQLDDSNLLMGLDADLPDLAESEAAGEDENAELEEDTEE